MNIKPRVLRSPEGGEGGGAAPEQGAGGVTDAGNQQASAPQAPEYLSKADFDAFRNELTGHLSRLTPSQREERESKGDKSGAPTEPDPSKYDFTKPGELTRYNQDNYRYFRHLDRMEEAKEAEAKQAQERLQATEKGHKARLAEYRKENPSFDEDMRKAGNIQVLNEVKAAIYASKNSPAIVHYLAKNKDVAQELNEMAEMEGVEEVRYRIGEISATIKAEKLALEANAAAAADKPPRQNFRGNSGSAHRTLSAEERYARFNK